MRIAKLIDGPCKGQVKYMDVDSFPPVVKVRERAKPLTKFERGSAAIPDNITVAVYVYHFKGWVNLGVAEYSIEVQKK